MSIEEVLFKIVGKGTFIIASANSNSAFKDSVREFKQGSYLLSCRTLDGAVRYCKFIVSK